MTTNFLAARNSNLSSFNVISINYSTIRGSTIASVSTMNVSTIVNSNITAVGINYSTLVGSSIVNNTVITQSLAYSTLTGSSITGSALTVGNIQGTSVSASTITTTGNVGIGITNPSAQLSIYGNTSSFNSTSLLGITNTNATPNASLYLIAPNMTANQPHAISLGKTFTQANCMQWIYTHIADGSTSNYMNFQPSFGATGCLYLAATGNVGIGITNPSSMLHVNGTTTFGNGNGTSNSNTNAGIITAPDSSGQVVGSTSTNNYGTSLTINGGRLTTGVWNNSNYGGDIVLAGGDMVDLNNNGTASGSYVGGNAVIRSGRVAVNNVAGNTQTVIPGSIFFQIGSGSRNTSSSLGGYNTAMTILGNGNVGIGTTSSTVPLHIYGTSNILTLNSSLGPTYMSFSANGAARTLIGIDNSAGEGLFGSGVAYGFGIGTIGNAPIIFATNNAIRMTIASNGNVSISGSLSKGSGTFDIEHPLYPNTNRRLVHSFIEGPRCDLIYRGIIVLTNGSASVYIDKQCTYAPENAMDDGTFEALCANPQYFLQNMSGFNRVIGSIYRGILTITCENNTATDTISWMVVAERKDPFVKNWDRTDSNGYLNTQYMK